MISVTEQIKAGQAATLCEEFLRRVSEMPHRIAVSHRGQDTSFEVLAAQATAFASWLRDSGLSAGDRVALLLPNSADYVACYLGILLADGIVVGLNPDMKHEELQTIFDDCEPFAAIVDRNSAPAMFNLTASRPEVLILSGDLSEPAETLKLTFRICRLSDCLESKDHDTQRRNSRTIDFPLPQPEASAQIIYTSGTTGNPKGVTLSHRNVIANCRSIVQYLQLTSDDSVLASLPFFYSYGNSLLFTHLAVGGRLVIPENLVFWNRILDLMERERVSGFSGVPSTYALLLHRSNFAKREFQYLRYLTCAGGALAPVAVNQIRETVPHVQLYLMYGQTEATARLSTLLPEEIEQKPGSIGRGIPGVELKVVDTSGNSVSAGVVGEIVARGDNIMQGYWNDPPATSRAIRDRWLWTGDLGHTDQDGYIFIKGRRNDIIKYGSYRLHPREIEDVALQCPGVAEVAVVGLPDEIWGEVPAAFVVRSEHECSCDVNAVIEFCRSHLPRHKMLREVRFVDSLPKTASGKVRRKLLCQPAGTQRDDSPNSIDIA